MRSSVCRCHVSRGVRPMWRGVVPHEQMRRIGIALLRSRVDEHAAVCPFAPFAYHPHHRPRNHVHCPVQHPAAVLAADFHDHLRSSPRPSAQRAPAWRDGNSLSVVSSPNHTLPPAASVSATAAATAPFFVHTADRGVQGHTSAFSTATPIAAPPAARWLHLPRSPRHAPRHAAMARSNPWRGVRASVGRFPVAR